MTHPMHGLDEKEDAFLARMGAGGDIAPYDARMLVALVRHWRRLETEAAKYVETPICMRTHFTGEQPYVGWKGLGLALREALAERDAFEEALKTYVMSSAIEVISKEARESVKQES